MQANNKQDDEQNVPQLFQSDALLHSNPNLENSRTQSKHNPFAFQFTPLSSIAHRRTTFIYLCSASCTWICLSEKKFVGERHEFLFLQSKWKLEHEKSMTGWETTKHKSCTWRQIRFPARAVKTVRWQRDVVISHENRKADQLGFVFV